VAAVFAVAPPYYAHTPPVVERLAVRRTVPLVGLTVAAALAGGLGNSMASFVVDAAQSIEFSAGTAARLLSVGSFTAIAMRVFLGWSADRRQRRGVAELASALALSAFGFLVLAFAGDNQSLFVAGVVISFAGAWGWPGVMYYVGTRSTTLPAATAVGSVLAGAYLGAVISPPVFGWLAEEVSYSSAFAVGAAITSLALAVALYTQRFVTSAEAAAGD
jgi:MFS family permease